MNLKRLLKLTLSALLLTAGVSAYAADGEAKVVTLKDKTPVTWSAFVNALNDPTTIPATGIPQDVLAAWTAAQQIDFEGLQKKIDDAQEDYDDAEGIQEGIQEEVDAAQKVYDAALRAYNKVSPKEKDEPFTWVQNAYNASVVFYNAYEAYMLIDENDDSYTSTKTVYYRYGKVGKISTTLILSFDNSHATEATEGVADNEWHKVGERELYDNLESKTITKVYVDLGSDYSAISGNSSTYFPASYNGYLEQLMEGVKSALQTLCKTDGYFETKETPAAKDAREALEAAERELVEKEGALEDAKSTTKAKNTALETAKKNKTDKQDEYDKAKEAYDKAVKDSQTAASANYSEVTLTDNVTADVAIDNFTGTINGNGKVITVSENAPRLFNTLRGQLSNVAVNGTLTSVHASTAVLNTVAVWDGDNSEFYNAKGQETAYTTLATLGFAARSSFGADLVNGELTPKGSNKVYSITIYNGPSSINSNPDIKDYFVNLKDGKFINGDYKTGLSINTNTFVESKTDDSELYDLDNIIINGTCKKVVITERDAFYCPFDIDAVEVDYKREFNKGMNAVCLPFDLEAPDESDGTVAKYNLCTYDTEDAEKFWFTKIGETVSANTPVLLISNVDEPFTLDIPANVTIKKTEKQINKLESAKAGDNSCSYGLLKKTSTAEILGAHQAYKVYGLSGGVFKPAGENAVFPSFRMVLHSDMDNDPNNKDKAPRKIGIRDEKGNDITGDMAGINDLTTDEDSSLSVVGGQGEIVITSEADYGHVDIYSIDGKVVAVADVVEGTTSVNVQTGIYIVMGKKVMVK